MSDAPVKPVWYALRVNVAKMKITVSAYHHDETSALAAVSKPGRLPPFIRLRAFKSTAESGALMSAWFTALGVPQEHLRRLLGDVGKTLLHILKTRYKPDLEKFHGKEQVSADAEGQGAGPSGASELPPDVLPPEREEAQGN